MRRMLHYSRAGCLSTGCYSLIYEISVKIHLQQIIRQSISYFSKLAGQQRLQPYKDPEYYSKKLL